MPLSSSGVVFVWFYVMHIFRVSEEKALLIDPASVFFHLLLNTCKNDSNTSFSLNAHIPNSMSLLAKVFSLILEREDIMQRLGKHVPRTIDKDEDQDDHEAQEEESDEQDDECQEEEEEEKQKKKRTKLTRYMMMPPSDFIAAAFDDEILHDTYETEHPEHVQDESISAQGDSMKSAKDVKKGHDDDSEINAELEKLDQVKDDLKKCLKALSSTHACMMNDLKKGGCYGYNKDRQSRCVYSNTGDFNIACGMKRLSNDARKYVSPRWVYDQSNLLGDDNTVHDFYSSHNYAVCQPGISEQLSKTEIAAQLSDTGTLVKLHEHSSSISSRDKDEDIHRKRLKKSHCPVQKDQITSLFAVEGEMAVGEEMDIAGKGQSSSMSPERCYHQESTLLVHQMTVLYDLHKTCVSFLFGPRSRGEAYDTVLKAMGMNSCLWCTLFISPGARRVLYDLPCMARDQTTRLGMGLPNMSGSLLTGTDSLVSKFYYGTADECESEAIHFTETDHDHRAKQSRRSARGSGGNRKRTLEQNKHDQGGGKSNNNFTLDLESMSSRHQATENVLHEWISLKYPFMRDWFAKVLNSPVVEDDIPKGTCTDKEKRAAISVADHCSAEVHVTCVCNSRRSLYDSDCYFRTHHTCLLPLLLTSARVLVRELDITKANKISNGNIIPLIARHHTTLSLTK